jgi:hypothetical protein
MMHMAIQYLYLGINQNIEYINYKSQINQNRISFVPIPHFFMTKKRNFEKNYLFDNLERNPFNYHYPQLH